MRVAISKICTLKFLLGIALLGLAVLLVYAKFQRHPMSKIGYECNLIKPIGATQVFSLVRFSESSDLIDREKPILQRRIPLFVLDNGNIVLQKSTEKIYIYSRNLSTEKELPLSNFDIDMIGCNGDLLLVLSSDAYIIWNLKDNVEMFSTRRVLNNSPIDREIQDLRYLGFSDKFLLLFDMLSNELLLYDINNCTLTRFSLTLNRPVVCNAWLSSERGVVNCNSVANPEQFETYFFTNEKITRLEIDPVEIQEVYFGDSEVRVYSSYAEYVLKDGEVEIKKVIDAQKIAAIESGCYYLDKENNLGFISPDGEVLANIHLETKGGQYLSLKGYLLEFSNSRLSVYDSNLSLINQYCFTRPIYTLFYQDHYLVGYEGNFLILLEYDR